MVLTLAAGPGFTCDDGKLVTTGCGDGVLEPGEECDDGIGGTDVVLGACQSAAGDLGRVWCRDCRIDSGECDVCGNGLVVGWRDEAWDAKWRDEGWDEGLGDEDCDGDDLTGETCTSLGLGDGTLACTSECTFDTSACSCGDGVRAGDEECDLQDFGDATCESLEHTGGGNLECSEDCLILDWACTAECGNAVVELGEDCDGDAEPLQTCEDLGLAGGPVLCVDCELDTSACSICGNGQLDLPAEECEAFSLPSSCEAEGFYGITPVPCDEATCTWDTSACTCGNGQLDLGEECDPEWGAPTCAALGFEGGDVEVGCDDCRLDLSNCCAADAAEVCGDGQDDDCDGEVDEGCLCTFGAVQRCWGGPPTARGVGACSDGQQECGADEIWGPCLGAAEPRAELCNDLDDDCNAQVDEDFGCVGESVLHCPRGVDAPTLHTYVLDASSLYDGVPSACSWTVECPLGGDCPAPADPDACATDVYFTLSGDYHVTLAFDDEEGVRQSCTWVVHVAGLGLRVELTWVGDGGDETDDLDLHLHRVVDPTTGWFAGDDCYYLNCDADNSIDWGYANTPLESCPDLANWDFGVDGCPNPRLDFDDVDGFGPENISVDAPGAGAGFRVMVHHFADDSDPRTASAVVRIYCAGELQSEHGPATLTNVFPNVGDLWRVADVVFDAEGEACTVTPLGPAGGFDIQTDDSRSSY